MRRLLLQNIRRVEEKSAERAKERRAEFEREEMDGI
jgi:hypothetical protein